MLYFLDANVLITAHKSYYPLTRVPEFWEWLVQMGIDDKLKLPVEMIEEICVGTDDLAKWLSSTSNRDALQLDEESDAMLVQRVIDIGYAPDLTDQEIETMGRDPFLISYALKVPRERCVVTTEVSKPNKKRANRHVPDVCKLLHVDCIDSFQLLNKLNFSTAWRKI